MHSVLSVIIPQKSAVLVPQDGGKMQRIYAFFRFFLIKNFPVYINDGRRQKKGLFFKIGN